MREYWEFKIGDKLDSEFTWEGAEVFGVFHVNAQKALEIAERYARVHCEQIRYNIRGLLQGHYVDPK